MRRPSLRVTLLCAMFTGSCAPEAERVAPLPTMRLLNAALLADLREMHLRVFPKTDALRCDAARGAVLVNNMRNLTALPGGDVQPVARCAAGAAQTTEVDRVDVCMRNGAFEATLSPGTYVVLVHGQGQFRRPTGETSTGVLGAGCAEVALTAGRANSIVIPMVQQVESGARCGNGQIESNETCEPGVAPGGVDCTNTCQTPSRAVSNATVSDALGNKHHPSVAWGPGLPLIVAFDVTDRTTDDTRVRYHNADGNTDGLAGALARDIILGGGMSVQQSPAVAPLAMPAGYIATWETFVGGRNVVSQAFEDRAPPTSGDPRYVPVPVAASGTARQQPSIAVAGNRVLVTWREGDGASATIRAVTHPVAFPLGAPTAAVQLASGAVNTPRAVALRDGSFVVVWSATGDVFARKVTAAGALVGEQVQVNPASPQVQDQPAVAAHLDGFVAAWHDETRDGDDNSATVRWARLGANLQRVGDARVAPTTTAGNQAHPTVAVGAGANPTVLIAWEDEASHHVRGRLARGDGTAVFSRISASTGDFQVSDGDGDAGRVTPSAAAGGASLPQFAVAWEDVDEAMPTMRGIRARLFPQ